MPTCTYGGTSHHHATAEEVRAHYATGYSPSYASVPSSASPAVQPPRPATSRQLDYIESLGGAACRIAASHLDVRAASAVIDELKTFKRSGSMPSVSTPAPTPATPVEPPPVEVPAKKDDPKRDMVAALLPQIPDGYYAVQEYEGGHVDFLRISRPKKRRFAGAIKVQTQHGGFGDGKFKEVAALWPSGSLSIWNPLAVDMLLILVADHRTAAFRYAEKADRCLRCNARLTDERSRHYHIGPECEKHRPDIIEFIDMQDALQNA